MATPQIVDPADWVQIDDACKLTGVSRRTIYNWLASGKLVSIRTVGGSIRIKRESLFKPSQYEGPLGES